MEQRSPRREQQGMVLLVVLASIALISTLLYSGVEGQRFQIYRVENELNLQQALLMARSAQPEIERLLNEQVTESGDQWVDSLQSVWAQPIPLPWDEGGEIKIEVTDLARFININNLLDSSGTESEQVNVQLRGILAAYKLPIEEMLDPLIDWLDVNGERNGIYGAEQQEYLDKVYKPTNGPLNNLQELALVKGWSTETAQMMRGSLIAHPLCRQEAVNINTASAEVLSVLSDTLLPSDVETIMEQRQEQPYSDLASFRAQFKLDEKIPLTLTSDCYHAKVSATVGKVKGRVDFTLVKNSQGRFMVVE